VALPSLAGDDGFGLGDGYARNTVVMDGAAAMSVRQKRLALREQNTKLVQELVWLTGQTHAQVNSRLNKLVGLRKIDEATVQQLAQRAKHAERWLAAK
jgi:hypothetical protein